MAHLKSKTAKLTEFSGGYGVANAHGAFSSQQQAGHYR